MIKKVALLIITSGFLLLALEQSFLYFYSEMDSKTFSDDWPGRSNLFNLTNNQPIPERNPERVRIVTLGDSFTAPSKEVFNPPSKMEVKSWPELLNEKLSKKSLIKFELFNFASAASNITDISHAIKSVYKSNPQVLILYLVSQDVLFSYYNKNPFQHCPNSNTFLQNADTFLDNIKFMHYIFRKYIFEHTDFSNSCFVSIVNKIVSETQKRNIRLYLFFYNDSYVDQKYCQNTDMVLSGEHRHKNLQKQISWPLFHINDSICKNAPRNWAETFSQDDYHLSTMGNAIITDEIYSKVYPDLKDLAAKNAP